MNKNTKGQVLVIFALALVGLLGFTALAIDGSMIYSDRRYAQNAADAAALAGASAASQLMANNSNYYWDKFKCDQIQPVMDAAVAKAIERGASNKYTLTYQDLNTATHGVEIQCVNQPTNKQFFVRVKITSTVNTGFAQLFFKGPIRNTVEGIAGVKPRTPYVWGNAIVAMDSDCSNNGVNFSGNTSVKVIGGGVYSNSCMYKNGGSGNINVADGGVVYTSTFQGHDENPPFTAQRPDKIPTHYKLPNLKEPACNKLTDYRGTNPPENLTPGVYDGMKGNRNLAAGLYCFHGDIDLSGSHNVFIGTNVTIYFVTGGFKITGTNGNSDGDIRLSAPANKGDVVSYAEEDVVIMMAPTNTSELKIDGNSSSYFIGLIVAPNQSVDLGGVISNTAYQSQIIGRNIKYHGTPEVKVTYYDSDRFSTPVLVDMQK